MILPVLFLVAALCSAQDLNSSARELARKIGRQDIASLTIRNLSSLSESQVAEVKTTVETELRARLQRPQGANVVVTLSENVQQFLWVAEIQRGEERDAVMLSVVRPETPATTQAPLTIEKKLIWEQQNPILDVVMAGPVMMILEPAALFFYREGQSKMSLSIVSPKAAPRDPRGRLAVDRDSFQAFLPGMLCKGTITPTPTMTCSESNGGGMAAGTNYFTEAALPPFFSSATLPGRLRILAGVDGRARVYDSSLRELGAIAGWGSDIAAVESGCGSGWQVLSSKPGDTGEPDALQGYEIVNGRATPAGDPVSFSGPITALWGVGQQAVAVTQSSAGRYAAYSLAIHCGH